MSLFQSLEVESGNIYLNVIPWCPESPLLARIYNPCHYDRTFYKVKLPIVPGHGNVWKAVMTGWSGLFAGKPCFRFFLYMSEKLTFKGQHIIKNYFFKRKARSDSPETSFGSVPYLNTLAFLDPRSFKCPFSSFSIVPSLRPTT